MHTPITQPSNAAARLVLAHPRAIDTHDALSRDVRDGLSQRPYHLPPKYFYDTVGSSLFDRICDTPEYYLTRAETSLLVKFADTYLGDSGATEIVELGSGAARKTRLLLDALTARSAAPRYIPVDVSEAMLTTSAESLLRDYPTLAVHGVIGDYRTQLGAAARTGRRLVLFLGSSIGNYAPGEAERLLADVGRQMDRDDALLIGFDLVKSVPVLERAYNDAQGITAEFNRNVLTVLNRELDADFVPAQFEHVAHYEPHAAQIEMHLRSDREQLVRLRGLSMEVPFRRDETIHTEISRKFTRTTASATLDGAGFDLARWDVTEDGAFALALARLR